MNAVPYRSTGPNLYTLIPAEEAKADGECFLIRDNNDVLTITATNQRDLTGKTVEESEFQLELYIDSGGLEFSEEHWKELGFCTYRRLIPVLPGPYQDAKGHIIELGDDQKWRPVGTDRVYSGTEIGHLAPFTPLVPKTE